MLKHNDEEFSKNIWESGLFPLYEKFIEYDYKGNEIGKYPVEITPEAAKSFVAWDNSIVSNGGDFEDDYPELYEIYQRAEALAHIANMQLKQLKLAMYSVYRHNYHEE